MTTEHWIEYIIPGSLFDESDERQITTRNVAEAVAKMPVYAAAFRFYDVEVRQGKLEDGEEITDRKVVNRSGRFYPDGVKMSLAEAIQEHGEDSSLVRNMRMNDYEFVVKTRRGNHQPLLPDSQILQSAVVGG